MTPKVAVVQGLRPAPFGTLASFFHERSGAAGGGAKLKLKVAQASCLPMLQGWGTQTGNDYANRHPN